MMKTCAKCKATKPTSEFHRATGRVDGLQVACKACQHIASHAWRLNHPVRARTQWLSKYGIDAATFDALLLAQKGACALCGESFSEKRRPCVDHDHATSEVRGLIHKGCNVALGFVERIGSDRFVAYLARSRAKVA